MTKYNCGGITLGVKIKDLLDSIKDFEPKADYNNFHEVRTFRLLNNQKDFNPECLYIGKASSLPPEPPLKPIIFLLIKDKDTPLYDMNEKSACIYVAPETDLTALLSSVQNYFDELIYVSECALQIMQMSKNTTDLQKLLDIGYELLGNPLLLVDVSLCFIAHAGGNTVKNEPLWDWTLSKGYVTEEYVNSILMDGFAEEGRNPQKPLLIWERGLLNHDQLVFRILNNNIPVGYLKTLAYNKPISETDQQIITILGNCLCPFLINRHAEQASCSPLIESFLVSLLNGKIYDSDAIDERVHQFDLKLYDNIVLIVIELKDLFLHDQDKAYIFKRKFQNFLGRDNIVFYDGHLVALYDFKSEKPFTDLEWTNFQNLLKSYNCRAGMSLIFHDLYSLPEQYRSGCDTLNVSWKLHLSMTAVKYSDIILQHVFLEYADHRDLTPLIHPALKTLQQLDPDRYNMFLNTVKTYINNSMDIVPTAKSLCVHYNTAKYRLSKIGNSQGLILPMQRLYFSFSYHFLSWTFLKK